jgi:hypothetical protein
MAVDDAAWRKIKRRFEAGGESFAALAREFCVSARSISSRARSEGWCRADVMERKPQARAVAATVRRPRDGGAAKAPLAERLYRAIDLKLTRWEERMTSGAETSAAESEREARELASMIRSYEAVADLTGPKKRRGDEHEGSAASDAQGDAERRRAEIAERLERLFDGGAAAGGAGEPER